jgi:ABC-type enterobactin transport system permease subunit
MSKRHTIYWFVTVPFALVLAMSGVLTVTHAPALAASYVHLGYPAYFMSLLGAAKLAGLAVLLAPGMPRVKEWAYAGFAINLGSAIFSHLSVHDSAARLGAPVVLVALLIASWRLRPASRTFPFAATRVARPSRLGEPARAA